MTEKIMTKPLKLLIAEDHELSRNGIIFSLQLLSNYVIVGEADQGDIAVTLTTEKHPDVILMDIEMPVMDGIEATQQIKLKHPEVKVVMLTSHDDSEEVYASLAAGANAYCKKDIKTENLIHVISMVEEGAVWLDPAVAKVVMQALPQSVPEKYKHLVASKPGQREKYKVDLTERELEVLSEIVEGKSNQEIADTLCITIHTVKAHVCNIIQKLSVDDRTQAAVKALRSGLLPQKP